MSHVCSQALRCIHSSGVAKEFAKRVGRLDYQRTDCEPLGFAPKRYVEDRDREQRVLKGLDLVAQDGQENDGVAGSGEEI